MSDLLCEIRIQHQAPVSVEKSAGKNTAIFVDAKKIRELLSLSDVLTTFSSLFVDGECGLHNRYTYVHTARSLTAYVSESQMVPELELGTRLIIEDLQSLATDFDSFSTSSENGQPRLCADAWAKLSVIVDGMNMLFRWFSTIASSIETHCSREARRLNDQVQPGCTVDKENDAQINLLVFELTSILSEIKDRANPTNKDAFLHQYLENLLEFVSISVPPCTTDRRFIRLASSVNVSCSRVAGIIKTRFDTLSTLVLPSL